MSKEEFIELYQQLTDEEKKLICEILEEPQPQLEPPA